MTERKPFPAKKWVFALAIAAVTLALYWPALMFDFVYYDDNLYITENPYVLAGLTWKGTVWAFTTTHIGNWHPLTWLSHMTDVQLFGTDARGHHLPSVLLHALNAVLLFLILLKMTKARWKSALVALLFALHPLHVESVAWISERKDVLSASFGMLAMAAYVRYARRGGRTWYLMVALFLALGLMAKPMIVTLPFLLMLLDYWPLGRLTLSPAGLKREEGPVLPRISPGRSLAEKLPLLAIVLASAFVTYSAQTSGKAVASLEEFAMPVRIANALATYGKYLFETFLPKGLAVFYPHPGELASFWRPAAGAAVALAAITALSLRAALSRPYLPVGWFWYLGTLVPVIGLIQVGEQAAADRYTYLPLTGLFLMLVWGGEDLLRRLRRQRAVITAAAAAIALLLLAVGARHQLAFWRDTESLFLRAVEVTENNHIAHYNLCRIYTLRELLPKAIEHCREAVRVKPDYADAHNNLGALYFQLGIYDQAMSHFQRAVSLNPAMVEGYNNIGLALAAQGRLKEAAGYYRKALTIDPSFVEAGRNLQRALRGQR